MVFMVHPLHGANNVAESEVVEQEKNGWTVSTHEAWLGAKLRAAPAIEQPKRRGRKPKVSNDDSNANH